MKKYCSILLGLGLAMSLAGCGTHNINKSKGEKFVQHVTFPEGSTIDKKLQMASNLVPSPQQLAWQEMELTAFLHFGINTFTGREWGNGKEDPALFNPTNLDAEQWVMTLKNAGFKMVILTAKHHDGFCLWQTNTTEHSVASSPWKGGKGDVVAEVAEACHKHGMKLGIYLSPWDRNHPTYGTGDGYNKVYLEQLTELLTKYGKVDEVWFDGANGEGPNGKVQHYDWQAVYEVITQLQPTVVTAIMGKDVRWVGNEQGLGRETEWSVTPLVPGILTHAEKVNGELGIKETTQDLGSRKYIEKANEMFWWPSEVDVSIRPGWFYHQQEDSAVKTLKQLAHIYFSSVGMNSSLLLYIPPNKEGRLSDADVKRIDEFGNFVKAYNSKNIVLPRQKFVVDDDAVITVKLNTNESFSSVLLQEDIQQGQRVESFVIEALTNQSWTKIAEGTTIGYKRILLLDKPIKATHLRVRITQSRGQVVLKSVKAHLVP